MAPRSALHTLVPIGRGAMATVYRAHDPERGGPVAVKYLHGCDAAQVRRLRREALAQRALDHPGICKVYDFGEDERGAYIVMQYIDGRPLDEALAGVGIERRLAVFAAVCDAVAHAHGHGLVHRDLKPDNILIEQRDDGSLHPYVVDFGLVRDGDRSTLTAAGDVLGTPAYMAPEQARGDAHVDRRADVFSLGAMLYQLLTGVSPFEAGHHSATLARVLHVEPIRPRRLAHELPPALERVVLHALEKLPRHRYDGAGALARDIRRHLAGETVHARRAGWSWRVRRSALRNPRSAAAAVLLLVASAAVVGWSVHEQRQARLQSEARALAAQRLGSALSELEWEVRALQLVPPHDIEPRTASVRARAAALTAELDGLGTRGEALAEYALGRASLALGDIDIAVQRLRRAVVLGHDGADAQLYLGLALAQRWIGQRATLDRVTDADARVALAADMDANLRAPALAALDAAGEAATPYANALARHLRGELEPDGVRTGAPWDFESPLLRAEILAARMDDAVVRGVGIDEASIRAAGEAVIEASGIAPSSSAMAAKACRVAYLQSAATGAGAQATADDRVLALCLRMTQLQPTAAASHAEPAHVLVRRYEAAAARGEGDAALLEQALALARTALAQPEADADARWAASDAVARAAWELRADSARAVELLTSAMQELELAAAEAPTELTYRMTAGATARKLAALLHELGQDPGPSIAAAVVHLEAAAQHHPDHAFVWNNLGYARKVAGGIARRRGEDPRPLYRDSIAALERAMRRGPGQAPIVNNLANAWSDLGQWQLSSGDEADGLQALDEAMALYERALAIDPAFVRPHNNRANIARIVAHHLAKQGADPGEWIARGFESVHAAIANKPDYPLPRFNAASMKLAEARYRYWTGGAFDEAVAQSRHWFDEGLALAPMLPARIERQQLELLALRDALERGAPVADGLAAAGRTLAALRKDAGDRLDVRAAEAELSLLAGAARCDGAALDTAARIGRELAAQAPVMATAARLEAGAALHRCECDVARCAAQALAGFAQALAALQHDDLPLQSLRLRHALAQRTGSRGTAERLAALDPALRRRVEVLAWADPAPGAAHSSRASPR